MSRFEYDYTISQKIKLALFFYSTYFYQQSSYGISIILQHFLILSFFSKKDKGACFHKNKLLLGFDSAP